MSTFLYRVGRAAFDHPWRFIAAWPVALVAVVAAIAVGGVEVTSEIRIGGIEAQSVLDRVERELPDAAGGQASVVFAAPEGERLDTRGRSSAIARAVAETYDLEQVIEPREQGPAPDGPAAGGGEARDVQSPPIGPLVVAGAPVPGVLLARSGEAALFQFQTAAAASSLSEEDVAAVVNAVERAESGTDIVVLPGDSLNALEVPVGVGEAIGLAVAAIVLVATLGSLVAAGLPLITALVGVGIGVGSAYALSTVVAMNSVTPVLGLMVGLAVGIDYALFVVNRQRRLIMDQRLSAREAAARAVATAGSAVFFAGLTVIVALVSLTVIGIDMLVTMALVAAATVALAVMIALTMLPAMLGLVGERICSESARERRRTGRTSFALADRWVTTVVRARWAVIVLVVAVLGVVAIPTADMELGVPTGETANRDTAARQSYEAVTRGFGEGFNSPLLIAVEPAGGNLGVGDAAAIAADLQARDDIELVSPVGASEDGELVVLSAIPRSGPRDAATRELVRELRSPRLALADEHDVKLGVTGLTALNIDMSERLTDALPTYVAIIVGLSLLILLLVFRSVIVPIKATLGFLLTILATFGATTAVFQWGWMGGIVDVDTGGPLMSFMPIIVTGILYGLAMDYQVFLVSSMREAHVHGRSGTRSVVEGFDQASRVVVAAAVIMISVFSGFIFSHDVMIKQIGFALAVGILIDAFLVRITLVPAVMALFGDRAWWLPKWLDRLLPDLDVEGDRLAATLRGPRQDDHEQQQEMLEEASSKSVR